MNDRTKKIISVLLIVIVCTLVGNLIVTQPILNRGIVIGMGVDKTENGETEVTVQIAVAGESSAPGAPNRYALVSGKGETLLSAMDEIGRITAYKPAYFHCHMLLFGEKLVETGILETAKQLFIEDSVMDDVAVMAVKGTAKETLERSVSMQGASSVYLQQLNKINSTVGGHPAATLKNLVSHFETSGYTPYLPWVEAIPVPKAVGGADTGGDEQNYVFDCSKTVLFHEDGTGIVAEKEVTEALVLTTAKGGMLLSVNTEDGTLDVNVKRILRYWHIEEDGTVTYRAVHFVSVIAENVTEDMTEVSDDYVTKHVAAHIRETIEKSYGETLAQEVDALSLDGKYHKKYGDKKEPKALRLRLDVTVKRSDA
ncbi:MAG: hypothetical protein IJU10_05515 [Clostridia bacterium]|nr:hypothetical protein [Clostridia bacterium]